MRPASRSEESASYARPLKSQKRSRCPGPGRSERVKKKGAKKAKKDEGLCRQKEMCPAGNRISTSRHPSAEGGIRIGGKNLSWEKIRKSKKPDAEDGVIFFCLFHGGVQGRIGSTRRRCFWP
ncbi:unnamed protein product, partial [Nesidiocoris tenuis]